MSFVENKDDSACAGSGRRRSKPHLLLRQVRRSDTRGDGPRRQAPGKNYVNNSLNKMLQNNLKVKGRRQHKILKGRSREVCASNCWMSAYIFCS